MADKIDAQIFKVMHDRNFRSSGEPKIACRDGLSLASEPRCDEPAWAMQVFDVRREPGVSHDAMMRRVDGEIDSPEALI
jgi:hypothetical protein